MKNNFYTQASNCKLELNAELQNHLRLMLSTFSQVTLCSGFYVLLVRLQLAQKSMGIICCKHLTEFETCIFIYLFNLFFCVQMNRLTLVSLYSNQVKAVVTSATIIVFFPPNSFLFYYFNILH